MSKYKLDIIDRMSNSIISDIKTIDVLVNKLKDTTELDSSNQGIVDIRDKIDRIRTISQRIWLNLVCISNKPKESNTFCLISKQEIEKIIENKLDELNNTNKSEVL